MDARPVLALVPAGRPDPHRRPPLSLLDGPVTFPVDGHGSAAPDVTLVAHHAAYGVRTIAAGTTASRSSMRWPRPT